MLLRSGQVPLRIDLRQVGPSDTVLLELVLAELHRVEELAIFVYQHFTNVPEGTSNAPILRKLKLERTVDQSEDTCIPFISSKSPLEFLESIHLSHYIYREVCKFFRPTMKHLLLDVCCGGSVEDFLHALGGMPLLETVDADGDFFVASPPSTSELPIIKLRSLRRFHLYSNRIVARASILDHLSFPVSALLQIWGSRLDVLDDPNEASTRFSAAIASKAAGRGLLGTVVSPVHILRIRAVVYQFDKHPTVDMWRDDASIHAADEPHIIPPSVPSTEPFCQYSHYGMYTASQVLVQLCSAAPHDMGSIRTLVISNTDESEAPWYELRIPVHFWSDSFTALVGLESLHLDFVAWGGFLSQLATGATVDGTISVELPFPRLRLMSLNHIVFRIRPRGNNPQRQASSDDFIHRLRDMLSARKDAGVGLGKLVISDVFYFDHEDLAMLGAYVDKVEWDGLQVARNTD